MMVEDTTEEQKEYEKNFPIDKFKKIPCTFTRSELARISSCEMTLLIAATMQKNAEQLMNTIFRSICMPRVGIKDGPDVGKWLDTATGVFYLYVPRMKKVEPTPSTTEVKNK